MDALGRGRPGPVAAVVALGAALTVVHATHAATTPTSPSALLADVVVPGVIAAALVAGGAALSRPGSSYDADAQRRIVGWALLGAVTLASFMLLAIGSHQARQGSVDHAGYLLADAATVGLATGTVVGLYDARHRRAAGALERRSEELARERDRFQALFEHVPTPGLYYEFDDEEPVVRAVNDAFVGLFGYDADELRGESMNRYIVPPGHRAEAAEIDQTLRRGEVVEREVRRRTAEGTRDFLLVGIPVDADDATAGFVITVDISDRKRQKQRLSVLNRVLRHDVRTDANVILGQASEVESAVDGVADRTAVIRQRAEDMVERSEKARLVERHLDRMTENDVSLDLADSVRSSVARIECAYPDARVVTNLPDACRVRATPLLERALDNVLENAVEHNPADEPLLDVRIGVEATFALLHVADDGPGVPEEERTVFEDGDETELHHSGGLGLWFAKWAVDDADGEVDIRDRPEGGTVVTVRLPLSAPTQTPVSSRS
jgi:PAS domain S-box-containing protein